MKNNYTRKEDKYQKYSIQENECGASWEVKTISGVIHIIQCRICKVVVSSGGTPKCLKENIKKQ
jgi:hypothetical protein